VRRFLVTGFGPFPGCPVNPSGALAEAVARRLGIEARVLPVTWDVPARLAAEVGAFDGVVALGVARGRRGVDVERRAVNLAASALPDAAGALGGGPLVPGAPEALEGLLHRAPFDAAVEAARARGLPVGYSDDAGRYLCNALFFHLLRAADGRRPVGFVHVPHLRGVSAPDGDADALDPAIAAEALGALVSAWFRLPLADVPGVS
jgi:pyroglutamyl-peptidase